MTRLLESKLLSVGEAAELLGRSVETLYYWRKQGKGPRAFRLGRRLVYPLDDLNAWVDSAREETSTGDL